MTSSTAPALTLSDSLHPYRYQWPTDLSIDSEWHPVAGAAARARTLAETPDELARDSRWPAFFPCSICLVTTHDGNTWALEKVVGASIVNRFPYVIALSLCRHELSARHYARSRFAELLESGGAAAIQFLPPGDALNRALASISSIPDPRTEERIAAAGLATRPGITNASPVFRESCLVYEARLARPGTDFEGRPIYERSWVDAGSHRIYFLEIEAIQLRKDIAEGRTQIRWRSLPVWRPRLTQQQSRPNASVGPERFGGYQKPYVPDYAFPSSNTIAFEPDAEVDGMAVKYLPPLPADQVEVDNDRARWPCFFPSSAGLITTWVEDGVPNVMPCGSTTVVSRHPFTIAPCVSYARINERYAPRTTLDIIRRTGRFGCGVPYIDPLVLDGIRYTGNVSFEKNPAKVADAGFEVHRTPCAPTLSALPVHFDCQVSGEIHLGTHVMFLGVVQQIRVRNDVSPHNPIEWCPWADIVPLR